jgi:TolB protein
MNRDERLNGMGLETGRSRRAALLLLLLGAAVTASVQPAAASWPGTNGRILFDGEPHGKTVILSMAPDGDERIRVGESSHAQGQATYSPDGRWVVFHRQITRHQGDIFVMRADGSHVRRLTHRTLTDVEPSWADYGQSIIYSRRGSDGTVDLFRMDPDGSDKARITENEGNEWWPAWSPDGDRIAYVRGNAGLYLVDADGSDPTLIADWVASSPEWAPDGDRLVVEGNGPQGAGIYVIDELGLVTQPIVLEGGWNHPVFSPDGAKIAAQLFYDFDSGQETGIYTMNADGSDRTLIRRTPTFDIAHLDWGPLAQTDG